MHFLKFLESGPFKYIIPSSASFFRYIDAISLIYPQDIDLNCITDRRDDVESSIKFTCEFESNNTQLFSGVLLIRNDDKLEFRVYRKATCKNDYIHFYSHYNTNSKRAVVIGF